MVATRADSHFSQTEISRLKSIKKELKSEEALAAENEEKRKVAKEEKMAGPLKLSLLTRSRT